MEHTTIMIANNVNVLHKVINSDYKQAEVREIFDNYWKIYENDPLVGRNKILASICPQVSIILSFFSQVNSIMMLNIYILLRE